MNMQVGVLASIHQWDVFAFRRIVSSRLHHSLVKAAYRVSMTGDGWIYPFIPVVIYLLGSAQAETFFLAGILSYALERSVYVVAKKGFRRRRPSNVLPGYKSVIVASDEFSFPSGHTSAAFLMVTLLTLFFGWPFALLYIWAASVAFSRIVLGVHFPSDTLVGACLGSSIAYTVFVYLT